MESLAIITIIEEAERLVQRRNVFRLGEKAFTVDGDTAHLVRVLPSGRLLCDCGRDVCPHTVAVMMILEEARLEERFDETEEDKEAEERD